MLMDLRRHYGDIARARLGPFITHTVAHPEYVKHVLQDNSRNYIRGRFYENFKLGIGVGLLTTDGEAWMSHRRVAAPLFHKRWLDGFSESMGESLDTVIEGWRGCAQNGQPIDIVPEMITLSIGIVGKLMFNEDLTRFANEIGEFTEVAVQAMMPQGNLHDVLPPWVPTPHNLRLARTRRAYDQIITAKIDEHRRKPFDGDTLIARLLAAHDEAGAGWTRQQLRDEVTTLLMAGYETTGTGLAWMLYAMSTHPHLLQNLREELDQVLGGRPATAADIPNLPYLQMIVEESLRLYPPVWAYPRSAIEDDEIGGYHIPAGSAVFVSPYLTQRHPDVWENPEAFIPERFEPNKIAARHNYAFFPFGGGPRKCIGLHVARMHMQFTLAAVAQNFDVDIVPGQNLHYGKLTSLRPMEGMLATLHPIRRTRALRRPNAPVASLAAPRIETPASGARGVCPFRGVSS